MLRNFRLWQMPKTKQNWNSKKNKKINVNKNEQTTKQRKERKKTMKNYPITRIMM